MTLALLDTCAYLRLAKRVRPLLGVPFGQKGYLLTVLSQLEEEISRNPTLKFQYPWFDNTEIASERHAKRVRLSAQEKGSVEAATSVLRAHILQNAAEFISHGRSPPSPTDCYCLAFGQIRPAIVVTDDLGMHQLAETFEIPIWHGHELLKKMLSAKFIDKNLVIDIYEALEINNDMTKAWKAAKHTSFRKIFGPAS